MNIPTGPGPSVPHPAQAPNDRPKPSPQQAKQPFVDPAILSFERSPRPVSSGGPPAQQQQQQPQVFAALQEAPATPVVTTKSNAPGFAPAPPRRAATDISKYPRKDDRSVAATLSAPFTGLEISGQDDDNTQDDTDGGFDGVNPGAALGNVRRVSLSKTRTGKPMDGPNEGAEGHKKTRRGGKGRKKDRNLSLIHI